LPKPNFTKIYSNLTQFIQICPDFIQNGINFIQICLKTLLVDAAASPAPTPLLSIEELWIVDVDTPLRHCGYATAQH